jgi:hypothetical protein
MALLALLLFRKAWRGTGLLPAILTFFTFTHPLRVPDR